MKKYRILILLLIILFNSCVTKPYTVNNQRNITSKGSSWVLSFIPGLTQFINGEYIEGAIILGSFIGFTTLGVLANQGIINNPASENQAIYLSDTMFAWSSLVYAYSYIDGVYSTYKLHNQKNVLENPISNATGIENLFTIKESVERDILGDITIHRMEIYNSGYERNRLTNNSGITSFSLLKKTSGNIQVNQIEVMYIGSGWLFLDNVQLKLDEQIYTLYNSNSVREVIGGRSSSVFELLTPVLSDEIVDAVKNCSSMIIQVNGRIRGEPIEIDISGLVAINNFY